MVTTPATAPHNQKKPTSSGSQKTSQSKATPSKTYSIDDPTSIWVIVNKKRPLPDNFSPTNLVTPQVTLNTAKTSEENSIRADVAPHLASLFAAAKTSGYDYMLASGYRSYALQNSYYSNYVATSGQAEADRYSARPGASEHQTGLALDVAMVDRTHYLDQAFGQDPGGQWLAAHAHEYGFIIRYLPDKEAITGYMYEPWHIRYVGHDLAQKLYERQQTMEEYFTL